MPHSTDDLDDDRYRNRGIISQIAITVFIGIPSTLALVVALSAYCTFLYAKSFFVSKPLATPPPATGSEQSFTASLSNLADIHAPAVQIDGSLQAQGAQEEVVEHALANKTPEISQEAWDSPGY